MATALEVTHILYLQDATRQKNIFPPGFSTGFNKLPIGVITKSDSEDANIDSAVKQLKNSIPKGPIVISSSLTGKGLNEIRNLVKCNSMEEMKEYAETLPNDVVFLV
jgi:ethanolamine utilization protein EutP